MDEQRSIGQMTNEEILALFRTSLETAERGFDAETLARVWAYEFVRSRARLAHYRALYTAFIDGGMHYMIENLDESIPEDGVPAKLVFTDSIDDVFDLDESAEVVVWSERMLLDELANERSILDYFGNVLDEFRAVVET